jgi:hypothetical protein
MTGRVIVVGDLHGCRDELVSLVALVAPREGDRVVCVGDFVTKGPDGAGCLELWRDRGWLGVRGNNDEDVLRLLRGEQGKHKQHVIDEARRLETRPDLVDYLASLPLIVDLPDICSCVVHGGCLPDMRISGLGDPGLHADVLLRARLVVPDEHGWRLARTREEKARATFWADAWDGDRFVIYGHAARPEIRRSPRALGIDTGCVYGACLTAAVRHGDEWTTESVRASRAYATQGGADPEDGGA